MTTKKTGAPKGTAHIRFVMLEADAEDGDLTNLANAITSALRSGSPVQRSLPGRAAKPTPPSEADVPETEPVSSTNDEDIVEAHEPEPAERPKPQRSKKTYGPKVKVLADLDLNSGPLPLVTFLNSKNPKDSAKRYLAIAVWFKEQRGIDAITVDHVYTCFRKMAWGVAIADMSQPFRDLKKTGRGDYDDGKFSINHIGIDVVNKLGNSSS